MNTKLRIILFLTLAFIFIILTAYFYQRKQAQNILNSKIEHTAEKLVVIDENTTTKVEVITKNETVEKEQPKVVEAPKIVAKSPAKKQSPPKTNWVKKGTVIGYQGYSGIVNGGSVLTLTVYDSSGKSFNPISTGHLIQESYLESGKYQRPLEGGILTTISTNQLSIVSKTDGNLTNNTVFKEKIICMGFTRPSGYISLRGYGAKVYAITSGILSKMKYDACGGKYLILTHDDGGKSMYGHLK